MIDFDVICRLAIAIVLFLSILSGIALLFFFAQIVVSVIVSLIISLTCQSKVREKISELTPNPFYEVGQQIKKTNYKEVFIYCFKYFYHGTLDFWCNKGAYRTNTNRKFDEQTDTNYNQCSVDNSPEIFLDKIYDTTKHELSNLNKNTKGGIKSA
ncbi:hypothetical protein SDC9_106779 [bioreactor metagenome]|uniref:Uncharacterized protein n=2 Tax=root TaxID=1 RepID=A0AB33HT86_9CHLR|nr:hypothetical protein [Dehalococcoides mccartyi]BAZ96874.1 hypothetical protein DEHALATV1_0246 [Dehalococcoides mccartyi]